MHAARTRGDLEQAFRLLPRSEPPVSLRVRHLCWSSPALQYALCNLVCILVCLFAGVQGSFWPKWVLVGTLVMYLRRLGRHSGRRPLPPADQAERRQHLAGRLRWTAGHPRLACGMSDARLLSVLARHQHPTAPRQAGLERAARSVNEIRYSGTC